MIILLSPSKTQKLSPLTSRTSMPRLLAGTAPLVTRLQQLSTSEIADMMGISDTLAAQTRRRFQDFRLPPEPDRCAPALLLFQGDVFAEINADAYTEEDFHFAQEHLCILSGLYGLLRPLDLVQPHRLEMGGKFRTGDGRTLYQYWREDVEATLNELLAESGETELLNLASQEYFKVVRASRLAARVVTASFKEEKGGRYRTIAIHAKRARGAMSEYIIRNRLTAVAELTDFTYGGYAFAPGLSSAEELVYIKGGT